MSMLVRLSPSPTPSLSSLEADEVDRAGLPDGAPPVAARPVLGLRELTRMYRHERRERKAQKGGSLDALGSPAAPSAPRRPAPVVGPAPAGLAITGAPMPPSYEQATGGDSTQAAAGALADSSCDAVYGGESAEAGRIAIVRSPVTSPTFARNVEIKGWKVVGGRSWGGGGKVGAYVVYEVVFSPQQSGEVTVLRRYTDFERLRDTLKVAYPHLGHAIPPLPGKNHMSKFSPTFLAERQTRLQRFLRTIALHPEMGQGGGSVLARWVLEPGAG